MEHPVVLEGLSLPNRVGVPWEMDQLLRLYGPPLFMSPPPSAERVGSAMQLGGAAQGTWADAIPWKRPRAKERSGIRDRFIGKVNTPTDVQFTRR